MGILRCLLWVLGSISKGVRKVSPSPLGIIPKPHGSGTFTPWRRHLRPLEAAPSTLGSGTFDPWKRHLLIFALGYHPPLQTPPLSSSGMSSSSYLPSYRAWWLYWQPPQQSIARKKVRSRPDNYVLCNNPTLGILVLLVISCKGTKKTENPMK